VRGHALSAHAMTAHARTVHARTVHAVTVPVVLVVRAVLHAKESPFPFFFFQGLIILYVYS
jgi:hypothetical protein